MKRLLTGGTTAALVVALTALAPAADAGSGSATADRTGGARAHAEHAAANLVAQRPSLLKASRHDAFTAGRVLSSHGIQYVPYERTYRGLPVIGGDFVVATDATGRVLNTNVAQTRPIDLRSVTPRVDRARARALSARQLHHSDLGRTRLVVLQRTGSRLAWETMVTGAKHGEASRQSVYVDARRAKVLTTREHVMDGTGDSAWEGTVDLPTTSTGSGHSMTNANASSLTCQDADTTTTFTSADDSWGDGDATSKETGCVDAFYSIEQERQMLAAWDGRNGMDGSGGFVPIRVGLDDVNAYYDGTQVQVGHNENGQWIGSIDVVAHEFGHGVDDTTPGGISGLGTQEFVADTFGAATEWYADNPVDTPDYTVGEQVDLVGNGPIRYMYDPSQAGDDNCYSILTPTSEVHAAAGPGNHWFYLLAEGSSPSDGQPTSPTCNSSSVTGLGIQAAEQIMYNAMLLKTSASSYPKYRTWTLQSAINLHPGDCTAFNTVKAAWDAVSVPAQAGDPTCS